MTDNSRSGRGTESDQSRAGDAQREQPKLGLWPKQFNPLARAQYFEIAAMRRNMVSPLIPFVRLRFAVLTLLLVALVYATGSGLLGKVGIGQGKAPGGTAATTGSDAKKR